MRASYMVSGIVLTILGLVILMGTGGFTFWAAGSANGDTDRASATVGLPAVLGWAMFLIGIAMIIIGAVADPYAMTASSGTRRGRDITVVK